MSRRKPGRAGFIPGELDVQLVEVTPEMMAKHRKEREAAEARRQGAALTALHERAAKAHARWCKLTGAIYDEPSRDLSTYTLKPRTVTLRSARGVVAKYTLRGGRLIRNAESQS